MDFTVLSAFETTQLLCNNLGVCELALLEQGAEEEKASEPGLVKPSVVQPAELHVGNNEVHCECWKTQ